MAQLWCLAWAPRTWPQTGLRWSFKLEHYLFHNHLSFIYRVWQRKLWHQHQASAGHIWGQGVFMTVPQNTSRRSLLLAAHVMRRAKARQWMPGCVCACVRKHQKIKRSGDAIPSFPLLLEFLRTSRGMATHQNNEHPCFYSFQPCLPNGLEQPQPTSSSPWSSKCAPNPPSDRNVYLHYPKIRTGMFIAGLSIMVKSTQVPTNSGKKWEVGTRRNTIYPGEWMVYNVTQHLDELYRENVKQ